MEDEAKNEFDIYCLAASSFGTRAVDVLRGDGAVEGGRSTRPTLSCSCVVGDT